MLAREQYLKQISDLLAVLQKGIEFRGINSLYDLNIIAEDFILNLLNLAYDYELENLNIQQRNQPGIDLGDEASGVAFQVTSTASNDKIRDTIAKFNRHKLYEKYSGLFVFIISEKEPSYPSFDTQGNFVFSPDENILDFSDLVLHIRSLTTERLKTIVEFLRSEIDVSQLLGQQLSPAEQYQVALHWAENGRKESLYGFNLNGCQLWEADLKQADLRMADLRNAVLVQADLQKADLRGAVLLGADLEQAALHEAVIDDTTQIEEKWRLVWKITHRKIGAQGLDLNDTDLSKAMLIWANLREADLTGADLSDSILLDAKMRNAVLVETNLRGADLQMADLRGVVLRGAKLDGADLREADLRGADLSGTDLSGATLSWGDRATDQMLPIKLQDAKYDESTKWPAEFDPIETGAVMNNEGNDQ